MKKRGLSLSTLPSHLTKRNMNKPPPAFYIVAIYHISAGCQISCCPFPHFPFFFIQASGALPSPRPPDVRRRVRLRHRRVEGPLHLRGSRQPHPNDLRLVRGREAGARGPLQPAGPRQGRQEHAQPRRQVRGVQSHRQDRRVHSHQHCL